MLDPGISKQHPPAMPTFAYLRVSGASQVEGDGFPRQRQAIENYAALHDCPIDREFAEEGVSGTLPWHERPAFTSMVAAAIDALDAGEEVTIIIENITRLAREFVISETIMTYLASRNIALIGADTGENITEAISKDPMRKAIIQMQAVFSELERNTLVRKLQAARLRRREAGEKCEGRKAYGEDPNRPEEVPVLQQIIRLRKAGHPFKAIADTLNEAGSTGRSGKPWRADTVAKIGTRNVEAPDELIQ